MYIWQTADWPNFAWDDARHLGVEQAGFTGKPTAESEAMTRQLHLSGHSLLKLSYDPTGIARGKNSCGYVTHNDAARADDRALTNSDARALGCYS